MMTDPIADLLTRIRNANRIESPAVEIPSTKMKKSIAKVLRDEGFVLDFQEGQYVPTDAGTKVFEKNVTSQGPKKTLRVYLKYGPEGEKVIRRIQRESRPGCRVYCGHNDLKPVLDGLGIAILSTSKGVMSDRQARELGIGGEMLCKVW